MDSLIIKPGGKLFKKEWVYVEEDGEGHWEEEDITEKASAVLFYPPCDVAEGVTLRDIFLLLKADLDIYKIIFNYWVEEIVEEGLSPCEEETEVQFTEVYWGISYDDDDGYLYGADVASFHGVSFDENGDRTNWSVSLSPANTCADLPFKIGESYISAELKPGEWETYDKTSITYGQILYAVLWELTWFGGPDKREKRRCEVNEAYEDCMARKGEDDEEFTVHCTRNR